MERYKNMLVKPIIGSIDITNRCNLNCLHCFNRSGDDLLRDELTDDEFLNVIGQISKIKPYSFCFCGGETFVRYELLKKSIKLLKDGGAYHVSLVTNGLLMTDEKAKELKEIGISNIQFSLDGSCPKTHNRMRQNPNAFKKVMEAIDILENNDMNYEIAFTPTNFNIGEIEEIFEMLKNKKNLKRIRSQPLMIMGRANEKIVPTETQYREFVQKIKLANASKKYLFEISWEDPIDHIIRFSEHLTTCPAITIQSNGDIVASPYLPFVFGNVKKYSLYEYINAGLLHVWQFDFVKAYTAKIRDIHALGNTDLGKSMYKDIPDYFDLVERGVVAE